MQRKKCSCRDGALPAPKNGIWTNDAGLNLPSQLLLAHYWDLLICKRRQTLIASDSWQ